MVRNRDKNVNFFHGKVSQWRRTNSILGIKDSNGIWWKKEDDIERTFRSYFDGANDICEVVRNMLSFEGRVWCIIPFDPLDIMEALTQMHP